MAKRKGGKVKRTTVRPAKPAPSVRPPKKSKPATPVRFTTRKDLPDRPFLVRTHADIVGRIDELRPMVEEYGRLKRAVEVLDEISPASRRQVKIRVLGKRGKAPEPKYLVKQAAIHAVGRRRIIDRAGVLAMVEAQPGITSKQLAAKAKVPAEHVNTMLATEGRVAKIGRRLYIKKF